MNWFKKRSWVYLPASLAGWIVTLATLSLILWVFTAVDRNSHSASDTLIGVFPYAVSFLVIAGWIAHNTSDRNG